jgi:CRISPR-associated protein Cmr4
MKGLLLGMLAETSIHPGMGQAQSVIDLPVAREATTGYPMIPGSSLKGVLRDKVRDEKGKKVAEELFGKSESIGGIGVTDARLLLLPVRSLSRHYQWVTCPYLLERFVRDSSLIDHSISIDDISVESGEAIVGQPINTIFLEEFSFRGNHQPDFINQLAECILPLIRHESVRKRLSRQLVVISDEKFGHMARYSLPVQARNVLDDVTKTSKNLWYEETIPPDTVMYSLLLERPGKEELLADLKTLLEAKPYLQVGGNETIGQGWFITTMVE